MGPLPSSNFPLKKMTLSQTSDHVEKMDPMDFDNVKADKAKALLHRFKSIGSLFRVTLEICLALFLLRWLFTSLPFAARFSGEFLRRLAYVVSSPLFMFVLGNSIVVALLTTKSTVFSSGVDGGAEAEADIYDAFIRSGESRSDSSDAGELTVYDDKQMIDAETASNSNFNSNSTVARADHVTIEPDKETVTITDSTKEHPPPPLTPTKVYRRSKSEKRRPETVKKPSLRRSETEKCREVVEKCEEEAPFAEDDLTNEEFQKTIEAFIAKQLIFRRRESLAVVIHNHI